MEKTFFVERKLLFALFLLVVSYMAIYLFSNYASGFFSGLPGIGTLFPLYDWRFDSSAGSVSPMFALMPLLGFLSVYFLAYFLKKEFDWHFVETAWFPVVLVFFSLLAFFFAPFFFYMNQTQASKVQTCFLRFQKDYGAEKDPQLEMGKDFKAGNCVWDSCFGCGYLKLTGSEPQIVCQINYLKCLGQSAFLVFVFGAIAGWVSLRVQKMLEGMS
ncbi:MAG: hypothetical protein QXK06_03145 [Candidatus Diapherotrites archaeon]